VPTGDTIVPELSKSFHKNGLVRGLYLEETEGPKQSTNQNVTNGPVSPDLLGSKVSVLRVGMDLQDHLRY